MHTNTKCNRVVDSLVSCVGESIEWQPYIESDQAALRARPPYCLRHSKDGATCDTICAVID